MRLLLAGLFCLGLIGSPSRGDDTADRARRVKVALALAGATPPTPAPAAGRAVNLDWFVDAPAVGKIEAAPMPRLAAGRLDWFVSAAAPAVAKAAAAPAAPANPCPPTPYAAVRKRVAGGEKVILLVRKPATLVKLPTRIGWRTVVCDDAPLMPGRYDCEIIGGRPCLTEVERFASLPRTALDWYGWLMLEQKDCPLGGA